MHIQSEEFGEYYGRYVSLSNGKPLSEILQKNRESMEMLFSKLNCKNSMLSYEKAKWSFKEVIGHVIDTERIFGYRALCVARDENSLLPGYDHDIFVKNAHFNRQSVEHLQHQYMVVRQSTIVLWDSLSEKEYLKKGVVNGAPFTVRALFYVVAGHEMHHANILMDKYLPVISER